MARGTRQPTWPLAEVFGFPANNLSEEAHEHRLQGLCPFNTKTGKCTKTANKKTLGVCSTNINSKPTITCAVRFQEDWMIARDAADFLLSEDPKWEMFPEVQITAKNGKIAGTVDIVFVSHDAKKFGSLEIQAVGISGNISDAFRKFMNDPVEYLDSGMIPEKMLTVDYLNARKRLVSQIYSKSGILRKWGMRSAFAIHDEFFKTLPDIKEIPAEEKDKAEIAWFLYDLELTDEKYKLVHKRTVYTTFDDALESIAQPLDADMLTFEKKLQNKLKKIKR